MGSCLLRIAFVIPLVVNAGEFAGDEYGRVAALAAGDMHAAVASIRNAPVSKVEYVASHETFEERPCAGSGYDTRPPAGFPWQTKTRCFFDGSGRIHHWVWSYSSLETGGTGAWGKKKPPIPRDYFVSAYALVYDKQLAYNNWVSGDKDGQWISRYAIKSCPLMRVESDAPFSLSVLAIDSIPRRLELDGRLRIETFAIALLRGVCDHSELKRQIVKDCAAAGRSESDCGYFSKASDFPNEGMGLRAAAANELQESLATFKTLLLSMRRPEYRPAFVERGDDLDPKRLPAELIERIRAAESDIASKTENVRMLQDAYRSAYEPSK